MKLGKRTERSSTWNKTRSRSPMEGLPCGPMVKILYFQSKGHVVQSPWLGLRPQVPLGTAKKKKKKEGWKRMGLMEAGRRFRREMFGEVP